MRAGEPCADTGGLPGASGRRGVGPISTFRGGRAAPRCPGVVTAQPVGSPRSPSCHQAARRPAAWCLGGLRGASAGCVVRRGAAWCVGWLRGASEGCVVRRLAAWCLGGLRVVSGGRGRGRSGGRTRPPPIRRRLRATALRRHAMSSDTPRLTAAGRCAVARGGTQPSVDVVRSADSSASARTSAVLCRIAPRARRGAASCCRRGRRCARHPGRSPWRTGRTGRSPPRAPRCASGRRLGGRADDPFLRDPFLRRRLPAAPEPGCSVRGHD